MTEIIEINLNTLAEEIGIDSESIVELLDIYCIEITEEMQQVKDFLSNQEWPALQREIHKIKGVSSNLFLQEMYRVSEELDIRLKSNSYEGIESNIHNMFEVFDLTVKSIKKVLEEFKLNPKE